jgi:hypothetical protein
MTNRTRFLAFYICVAIVFSPIALFAHGKLVLKSKTCEQCYSAKIRSDGSFSFENVKPGTYTLLIVGPKEYFTDKADEPNPAMTLQNLHWIPTESGAMNVSSVTAPAMTITADMLIDPGYIASGEHKREYSILLYSKLATTKSATLSGNISNFSANEKEAELEHEQN